MARWWLVLWLVVCSSCATTFYESPRRPAAETATVESRDTVIDEVDGKDVQRMRGERNVYLLPPGPHVIAVSYLQVTPGLFTTKVATSKDVRICVRAEAGHRYVTAARLDQSAWSPQVIDRVGGEIPVRCDPQGASSEPEIVKLWSTESIARARARPFLDLLMNVGFAFGGDNLVTAPGSNGQTLGAGQGLAFGFGAMLTPLWVRDRIGFGAGGEVGVRYDDVSVPDTSLSFTRYPTVATLHALTRVGQSWFVLLAGGAEMDHHIRLSGTMTTQDVDTPMTSRLGGVARVGVYYRWTDAFALTFGLGYTRLTYDGPDGSVNASNVGVWTNLHWAL